MATTTSNGKGGSRAGAPKSFSKLTAPELRKLIREYADERGIEWPDEDPTRDDIRDLLQLDLDGLEKIGRDGVYIDGELFTDDDLSFGEQDELLRYVREFSGDDEATVEESRMFHVLPALVTVVKRRSDENYSLDDAKALKPGDLVKPSGAKAK